MRIVIAFFFVLLEMLTILGLTSKEPNVFIAYFILINMLLVSLGIYCVDDLNKRAGS